MGVEIHTNTFKTPRGLLKIVCLCMVIIVLVLARTGFAGGYTEVAHAIDAKWVTITSVCAYAIILSIIIITYFLGDAVPIRMEMMFMLLGAILFVASGSLTVEKYQNILGDDKDVGLALGSMSIITGIFMIVDFGLLAKDYFGK
jgi:hypothetical protein